MIVIRRVAWLRSADHVCAEAPDEACGFLAAYRYAPDVVEAAVPMLNVADRPRDFYAIDAARHMEAVAALDAVNMKIIGDYHSHVNCGMWLSPHDLRYAVDPTKVHLVVGYTTGVGVSDVALWQVRDGVSHPVRFHVERT